MVQLKRDDTMPAPLPFFSPIGRYCAGGLVGEMQADLAYRLAQQFTVSDIFPNERSGDQVIWIVSGVTGARALFSAYCGVAVAILR